MNIFKISDAYLNQTSHLLSGKGSANLYPPPRAASETLFWGIPLWIPQKTVPLPSADLFTRKQRAS